MSTIRVVNIQHSDATEPNIVLNADGTATFVSGITISGGTNLTVSGTAEFASGTVSAPGITFIDDNNTGIYEPAADTVAITTAATERLRVDSSGRVGIGTTSPGANLDISPALSSAVLRVHARTDTNSVPALELQRGASTTWGSDAYMDYRIKNAVGELIVEYGQSGNTGEWMRIDSFGRLLVGTSSAVSTQWDANLQVVGTDTPCSFVLARNDNTVGSDSALAAIRVFANDSNGTYEECARISAVSDGDHGDGDKPTRLVFSTTADDASSITERMRIDSSGNVGIGATSVPANFRVEIAEPGNVGLNLRNTNNSAGDSGRIAFSQGSGNLTSATTFVDIIATADTVSPLTGNLKFRTNQGNNLTEAMRIDSSGRLLVGTSSNLGLGVVQIPDTCIFRQGNATSAGQNVGVLKFGDTRPGFYAQIKAEVDATPGSNDFPGRLVFSTTEDGASSSTERMRIDNSGNVKIGTTSDGAGAGFATRIAVSGGDTSMFKTTGVGASSAAPLRAWHDATSGNNLLQMFHTDTALNTRGTISYDRSNNLLQYNTTSDARLKTNITDASSALSDLGQVRVRSFDWIEEGHNRVNYGFVAQELNAIAPYAVSEGDHEDEIIQQWGVSNSSMVPLLTKALQEAIAKIETLQGMVAVNNITIDEQQHQLSTLAARLTALESA